MLRNEIAYLKEQIAWFQRQIFGQRSERIVNHASEAEQYLPGMEPAKEEPIETVEVPAHHRKKRKAKNDYANGLLIPENTPVEQVILDLPKEEKICPETGETMQRIGEDITRQLAYRAAHYYVKEIIRPKYALPSQEEAGVFQQELPSAILPKSRADESLLAEIVTRKFADHLPLNRLSEIFSRDGIQITRQLLSQWLIRLGFVLKPLYDLMLQEIKKSGIAFIDETPVQLQVKGKGKLQKGYMWVVAGGAGSDSPYRLFHFCENRNHEHAYQLLEGFSGVMHSDKYGCYEHLAKQQGILWQPCWAHIRRKFEEADSGDLAFRKMVLRKIHYLFRFEKIAWQRSAEERLKIRKEREAPLIDALIEAVAKKIATGGTLPKSQFSKALHYFHDLIPHLKNYHLNPDARMDNNPAERAIRPIAIGRKNWIFVGSMKGGQSTAVLISLVQTCRCLNVNPAEYLEDIMRRFLDHPANRLDELLPHRWAEEHKKHHAPIKSKPLHVR